MKLWGGRFTKTADTFANHFHSSISFDKRLYRHDIKGSIAHAEMLGRQGIISKENSNLICKTLLEILEDIENSSVSFEENAEDIHMNIETILISRIGDVGKQLHTGRSRNDQVALDMRMYVKEEIKNIQVLLSELMETLINLAENSMETIMPGYTHLQPAQPITFAHHMLAYVEMLKRDYGRLTDAYKRTDHMPLGSGALASTTYPLDREYVAEILGFEKITLNSLDAVADRDFCIELLSCIAMTMMHLSRFCEELIIWSSNEFKFIELDDSYSTGSSIMPQKKNPDMAELIRGKTGRTYGNLVGLLTVMKGLPLAYNKDMQEDKEQVFDSIDTIKMCLPVLDGMLKTMMVKSENMLKAAGKGFINATDAADWLTKKGVPFRDSHEIIGKLVLYCIDNDKTLEQLTIEEYKSFSPVFDETVLYAINPQTCVSARNVCGGPSKEYIEVLINENKKYLKKIR